jgi:RNA recognition motif-containing protein
MEGRISVLPFGPSTPLYLPPVTNMDLIGSVNNNNNTSSNGLGSVININPMINISPSPSLSMFSDNNNKSAIRTIHVGNIRSSLTEDQLKSVFSPVGKIVNIKLIGDTSQPYRFAFIEFSTVEEYEKAKLLSGTILFDVPIKFELFY